MKRIGRRQNFKPAFVVPELPCQLEQTFVGLRAAVGEKAFPWPDELHQCLGQPPLRFVVVKVGNVNESLGLLDECFGDGRMRVAKTAHGNTSAEIEVTLAIDIEQMAAGPVT